MTTPAVEYLRQVTEAALAAVEGTSFALARASHIPPAVAASYGVGEVQLDLIVERLTRWAAELT